jgi:hypothetical protein
MKIGGRYRIAKRDVRTVRQRAAIERVRGSVLSRRTLLKGAGGAVGVLALDAFYDAMKRIVWEDPASGREARELFRWLFGTTTTHRRTSSDKHRFDYAIGRQQYGGPSHFHPDNWAAGVSVAATLESRNLTVDELRAARGLPLQLEGEIFIAGGPNSTQETSVAWEFEGSSDQELDRREGALLPLRWWGVSNRNDPGVTSAEPHGYIMEDVGPTKESVWPLIDRLDRSSVLDMIPTDEYINVDGERLRVPGNNYLIATRVPNYLDPGFPTILRRGLPWPHLLVFEGANGIGTRAVELLSSAAGLQALQDAVDELDGAREFQLLFEAYAPQRDVISGFHRFSRIRLVAAHKVTNVEDQVWEGLHNYAQSRIR